jgi:hypothetical protein
VTFRGGTLVELGARFRRHTAAEVDACWGPARHADGDRTWWHPATGVRGTAKGDIAAADGPASMILLAPYWPVERFLAGGRFAFARGPLLGKTLAELRAELGHRLYVKDQLAPGQSPPLTQGKRTTWLELPLGPYMWRELATRVSLQLDAGGKVVLAGVKLGYVDDASRDEIRQAIGRALGGGPGTPVGDDVHWTYPGNFTVEHDELDKSWVVWQGDIAAPL